MRWVRVLATACALLVVAAQAPLYAAGRDHDDFAVPPEAGEAKSAIALFREAHPGTRSLPEAVPWTVLVSPQRDGVLFAVFAPDGDEVYRNSGIAVRLLPAKPVALAFRRPVQDVVTPAQDLVLVGFRAKEPASLTLEYRIAWSSGVAILQTWLEDVDGDGAQEICQFYRGRLRCVAWDAQAGRWHWLQTQAGTRAEKDVPPIRWRVRTDYDAAVRVAYVRLEMTNLATKPLVLDRPREALFPLGTAPKANGASGPLCIVPPEGAAIRSVRPTETPLTVPPGGVVFLDYEIDISPEIEAANRIDLRTLGRAQWRWFEAQFDETLPVLFRPKDLAVPQDDAQIDLLHIVNGLIDDERLDRAVRSLIENRRFVPAALLWGVSDETRQWIARRALAGKGGYDILQRDPSDGVVGAILAEVDAAPPAEPRDAERLIWLALSCCEPDEYPIVLDRMDGENEFHSSALRLLLRSKGHAVNIHAAARILSTWPDPKVAADARVVLGRE